MKTNILYIILALATMANLTGCDSDGSEALHPGFDAEEVRLVIPEGYSGYTVGAPLVGALDAPLPAQAPYSPLAGIAPLPPSGYSPLAGGEMAGYGNQTTVVYSDNPTGHNSPFPPLQGGGASLLAEGAGEYGEAGRGAEAQTRVSTSPDGTCQWQTGDKLYIGVTYFEGPTGSVGTSLGRKQIIATRAADGTWQMDGKLYPPSGTQSIRITANYTGNTLPGEPVYQDDLLMSTANHNFAEGGSNEITIGRFVRTYSKITFTGLRQGDEVTFNNSSPSDFQHAYLGNEYTSTHTYDGAPVSATAGADGTATFYGQIDNRREINMRYTVTRGIASWPGTFTISNLNDHVSRRYSISCIDLFVNGSGGSATPEYNDEVKRFLRWASDVRAGKNPGDFLLKANIDLSGVQNFEPITVGSSGDFNNTFDGGGHTIYGLKIETTDDYAGLFRYIGENGSVKNLHLEQPVVRSTSSASNPTAAGIAGSNTGDISHCTVTGANIEGPQAGGIAGYNYGSLTHCSTLGGTVKDTGTGSSGHAGGITACNTKYGTFTGSITACHSQGVAIEGRSAGGIVGRNSSEATTTACYTGSGTTIKGTEYAGGIAGYNSNGAQVTACYSLASSVTCDDANYLGGIAGWNYYTGATITACHWLVGAPGQPMKAVGSTDNGGVNPDRCYFFMNTDNFYNNGNGGNLMNVMNNAISGSGWVWRTNGNGEYPYVGGR